MSEKELVDAFKEMDVDKNGYISYREMVNALTQSGENMGKREVKDLIESADINRDDKIDYKEVFSHSLIGLEARFVIKTLVSLPK